jgi:enoyl-CoA hydratase/carnithine racemase
MLELLLHCRYIVAVEGASLGFPEVTLPVMPGMEGCHWPIRKSDPEHWPRILHLLLSGRPVRAGDAVGWLIDYSGPMEDALKTAWELASGGGHGIPERSVETGVLDGVPADVRDLPPADSEGSEIAREAIRACAQDACGSALGDALAVQARHAADFLASPTCRRGMVGAECKRVMSV